MDILKEQIFRTKELMGIINENWRDTSWEDDDGKITIGDITDYIGNDVRNISVTDLQNKLKIQPATVTQEKERIMKADLQYPIILVQQDGEFSYVLDGNHRLAKAIMTGEQYIKAKVLYLDDKNTPEEFKRLLGGGDEVEVDKVEVEGEGKDFTSTQFAKKLEGLNEGTYNGDMSEEEEWERGKKRRGKSGPGTYGNDDVFPGPEESAISRFLKSKPEGGGEMLEGERKANEILKYIEFEVRGWIFDNNKRVTQETPGYFLENNSKMVSKIAEILS